MRRATLIALGALVLISCTQPTRPRWRLSSFDVKVTAIDVGTGSALSPLSVVTPCLRQYNGFSTTPPAGGFPPTSSLSLSKVPQAVRGTEACPYLIMPGNLTLSVEATALGNDGKPLTDFVGPVSFRSVPGDLTGPYATRYAMAVGGVAKGVIQVSHLYSKVRVWAEDAPIKLTFGDGGVIGGAYTEFPDGGRVWLIPDESKLTRTYASGISPILYFEEPSLAKIQVPDLADNRTSPLIGEFITVGKRPESGEQLRQSCADDPARDTQASLMVVTGMDPGGFFVTDLTACRQQELGADVKTFEPKESCVAPQAGAAKRCAISGRTCASSADCLSYLPGSFGSMYVYNYSYPDGLDEGDLLFTLGGAVQEFTGTTQLVFPSWTIAEKVRRLPQDQWNKWLKFAVPTELNRRICGGEDAPFYLTDQLCGHNRRNMKAESLESALVRLTNVRFPEVFAQCDLNANYEVPFFCEQKVGANWVWGTCAFGEVEPPNDTAERQCNMDCVLGTGEYAGKRCSEKTTFAGFGQFVIDMNAQGPADAGFDESLGTRSPSVVLSNPPQARSLALVKPSFNVQLYCDAPVHYRFGDAMAVASASDPALPAKTPLDIAVPSMSTHVSFLAQSAVLAGTKCWASTIDRTLVNLVTKDAIPELQPDCREDDPDGARAKTCKALHAARYDIVGHFRQVQPARPRWVVIPRDVRDVCCHPGEGLDCPYPISKCP